MAKHRLYVALAGSFTAMALVIAGCGTDSGGGSGPGSGSTIQIWEGWTGAEAKAFAHLVSAYEQQHPARRSAPSTSTTTTRCRRC